MFRAAFASVFALLAISPFVPAYSGGIDLNAEIFQAEIKSAAYHDRAQDLSAPPMGSMGRTGLRDSKEFMCYMLGRMLGKHDLVRHIKRPTLPPNPRPKDYSITAGQHDMWSWAAKILQYQHAGFNARSWNRNCVGEYGIPTNSAIRQDKKGHVFLIQVDGDKLIVHGDIVPGYHKKLVAALNDNPSVRTVSLASDGGHIGEAIRAGFAIRKRGLDTELVDDCASACPLVFLGGVDRFLSLRGPKLGFHRVTEYTGEAIPINDPLYAKIGKYAEVMGANPRLILTYMLSAPPERMYWLNPKQVCSSGLTTSARPVCL